MAVTDPDARPHQRASMFLVPADTPGVNILRDVPTMEHPAASPSASSAATPRSSTRTCASRPTRCSAAEGAGFLIAQHRLVPGPHPPLHALARRRAAGLRHALRARDATARRTARSSADKQTVQNWIADSAAQMQAARLMTLHAAWKMDTQGVVERRARTISLIKFFGAQVLHDVDRPRAAGPRLARLLDRPAAGGDVPLRARRAHLRRARRGPPRSPSRGRILRGYEPPAGGVPSEHVPTRREAARRKFAEVLDAVTAND